MEVEDGSPYLQAICYEPYDDDEGNNVGIEGPFDFERHFKMAIEMLPVHHMVSFKFTDSDYEYCPVTTSLVVRTRLATNLPEGFLPVPYYGVWMKYLKGYKDRTFPSNTLYLREYMVKHKHAFEQYMDGFRPQFQIRKSWVHAPLPEDLYMPWERSPTNNEEMETYVYSPTSVFCDGEEEDISEVEQGYDLLAFRCLVFMNLRLWNPVDEQQMLRASKNLRRMTRKRLFGLFNGSLEQSWERNNDDNEDETFQQDLEKRRCWSKYVMVWNAFMVDAVIFIDVVQNIPEDAFPRSLGSSRNRKWDPDERQIDIFYTELLNFKIGMSKQFIDGPTSSFTDVFNNLAIRDAENVQPEPFDNGFTKKLVMQAIYTAATIHIKKVYDPFNIFIINASKKERLNGVVENNVFVAHVVDGVPAPDEEVIDEVNVNVEEDLAVPIADAPDPVVPVADVPNGRKIDDTTVAAVNVSDQPLIPNGPVVPAGGVPSLLNLNLPDGFIPPGFQPNPAIGLLPRPLMELPIQPPPGFPINQLPPLIFRANTPQQPPNSPHLSANVHHPDTPYFNPNQPHLGYPNNHLPPLMRADTPFPHLRPNTPYPRPDTPFHPNHPLPVFHNGPAMQWHHPQQPPNPPHMGGGVYRPDTPFFPPGFQNGPAPPPYHSYLGPQAPFMHPNFNAPRHQFARGPRGAGRRGRRQ